MKVKLFVDKSVEENAAVYFDRAKKLKRKIEGAKEALEESKKQLEKLEKAHEKHLLEEEEKSKVVVRKKEWYEKFRWFFSSEGFLILGGRDATTNEILIKKHTEQHDLVFHTDMAGSPFFVIKSGGRDVGDATLNEVAQATASYSKAWKLGLSSVEVFYVKPDQVSKEAQSGESLPKGAFVIRGKTTYIHPQLRIAIGVVEGQVIGGAVKAVEKNAEAFIIVKQGRDKTSEVAKKIKHKLGGGDLDEIIRFLPAGGCKI